ARDADASGRIGQIRPIGDPLAAPAPTALSAEPVRNGGHLLAGGEEGEVHVAGGLDLDLDPAGIAVEGGGPEVELDGEEPGCNVDRGQIDVGPDLATAGHGVVE